MPIKSPIIVALDFATDAEIKQFTEQLTPDMCRLKIGKEAFTRFGPVLVRQLIDQGFDIFLDLKFHDIPNTVAQACKAAADLGVWMVNVHACGGYKMMQAARQALDDKNAPLLIAVTVLTNMETADLTEVGLTIDAQTQAKNLALLTQKAQLDGVVCSAQEASLLRHTLGKDFVLATPGIRPVLSPRDDQKRIMTPTQAIEAGADYLVIGRPITQSTDPVGNLLTMNSEINSILSIN